MSVRDEAMHVLGIGTTHDMRSVISGIFLPVWQERAYTLGEKVNIWRGKWSDNSRNLWNQMMATNITIEVPKLDIPVYFLHGIYDYTVSYTEAKSYFEKYSRRGRASTHLTNLRIAPYLKSLKRHGGS